MGQNLKVAPKSQIYRLLMSRYCFVILINTLNIHDL